MRSTIAAYAALAIWLGVGRTCPAQPAVDRLEEMIRQERLPTPPTENVESGEPVQKNEQGYLGAMVDDREDRGRGVRVLKVFEGAPAEKALLQPGDLITGIGGVRVRSMDDLAAILNGIPPGRTLTFDVLRGTQQRDVSVTLGRRPVSEAPAVGGPPEAPGDAPPDLKVLARRCQALEQQMSTLSRRMEVLERQIEQLQKTLSAQP